MLKIKHTYRALSVIIIGSFSFFLVSCGHIESNGESIPIILQAPNLTGEGISSSSIRLEWQPIVHNFDSTRIVIERRGATVLEYVEIVEFSKEQVTYLDMNLAPSSGYEYRTRIIDSSGQLEEQISNTVLVDTPDASS